ncbi:ArnT family glycosyltransferase [Amycolatopsis aidingensis]|uniref:ArnT family glycosyltransferase n=1 Tax=Amycolatopsis aidingensis TaxID=2842453 RepID=UPI001E44FC91|nr:glycosyltransferase family 39 protein [Amycolatopsis aidingensis]
MTMSTSDARAVRWMRPAVATLLLATAVLYLWGLGESGWANAYYSAAAQAGGQSWTAWFFGATDPAGGITVDKAPAALWVTGLSVRLFGLSSWSILVPQALCGVAAVGLTYATVRRCSGPVAGLLAGAVLALTPVAVLMFRFNNPDALLVLLLVAAAYALVRALERGGTGWLLLAGTLLGFGFLAKMLQALLVVPAFVLVYLLAAPVRPGRRLGQVLVAAVAMVVAAGWWVLVVRLWPAGQRPYIGGSQTNSVLELTLGYNGFGRLTGEEVGSVGGGRGWGDPGWTRLLGAGLADQASWLLPAAVVFLGFGLWLTRRAPRTDRTRAAFLLWGGWLLVTAAVFSYMDGIFHSYYTVALAPAIAALVGSGAVLAWRWRFQFGGPVLAATAGVTGIWGFLLLRGSGGEWSVLPAVVLFAGLLAAALLFLVGGLPRRVAAAAVGLGLVAALAGPAAYSVATAATPHSGALPAAGPGTTRFGGPPGGGGMGGLLGAPEPGAELAALLAEDAGDYTWAAAAVGSNNAAGYQLAARVPVLAVGGFNGTDPAPTLARFQQYVRTGQIHFFLGGPGMRGDSGSDESIRIAAWVAENFTEATVDGVTVYDLTA